MTKTSNPTEPDPSALACLKHIRNHRVYLRPGHGQAPCFLHVLRNLEANGLIEKVSDIHLPLELSRLYYRITRAGACVLEQGRPDNRNS